MYYTRAHMNKALIKKYKFLFQYLSTVSAKYTEVYVREVCLPEWWCCEFEYLSEGSYVEMCSYIARAIPVPLDFLLDLNPGHSNSI